MQDDSAMSTFFRYSVAAKGLVLTSASVTAALSLLSPHSLTALAADQAGYVANVMAVGALLMAAIGWADIVWSDLMRRTIVPSLHPHIRHHLCVTLYAMLSGWYGVFAYASMDPSVSTSWILVTYYLLIAAFAAVFSVALAVGGRE